MKNAGSDGMTGATKIRRPNVKARFRAGWICAALLFFTIAQKPLLTEPPPQSQILRRFVLAVGATNGGNDRLRLRYALSDARSVVKVFQELGGVAEEDTVLVLDPDLKTFYTEVGRLQERMGRATSESGRVELIFYYSGHSDESHLLLGREKVSYADLRGLINGMPADVRIGILDSCSSGAFTRMKGGKKRPPFLVDESFDMKGYAFMTSSSATEVSQESDFIQASFFTHYLISALRGAADRNQDGRITLSEAYQFAFDETLAETTKTSSGPQHPNYNIDMSGRGDVVMTDIRKSSTLLCLGPEISGKIFIHDADEKLVLEMRKPEGREIQVGLEEGRYRIILISMDRDEAFETTMHLEPGKSQAFGAPGLVKVSKVATVPRGPAERAVVPGQGTAPSGLSSAPRHALSVSVSGRGHFQSSASDFAPQVPGDVIVMSRSGGPFVKLEYSFRVLDRWAADFCFENAGKSSLIKGDYLEDCSFLFVRFGLRYFLLKPAASSALRPYLAFAPGLLVRDGAITSGSVESSTESAFAVFGGVGTDILLGRFLNLVTLNLSVEGGLNLVSSFSKKIGGLDNMSGMEISAGMGFIF